MKLFRSVRSRLTLWYMSAVALVLIVFAVFAYNFFARTVEAETDSTLAYMASEFAASFAHEADEHPEQNLEWAADMGATLFGDRYREYAAAVYDPREQRIIAFVSRLSDGRSIPEEKKLANLAAAHTFNDGMVTLTDNSLSMRSFFGTFPVMRQDYVFIVMQSLAPQNIILNQARDALLIGTPLAMFLAGLGGYFLARKTLAPVATMSSRADEIQAVNLHHTRLPVTTPDDELGQLAQVFNRMLERLDDSMEQQRKFMADASHELRTPISIVRCESEVTLGKERRSEDEYRDSFAVVCDESHRMTRIVDDLFLLARADAGQYPQTISDFYLEETLTEGVRSLRKIAQVGKVMVTIPTNIEMPFQGDQVLIHRLFINLLDNSVKHTAPGGSVEVTVEKRTGGGGAYRILFSDTGTGIKPDDQPHIFERFFRSDKSRSQTTEGQSYAGAGLELSIAWWICEIHQGQIELVSSDKTGTTFAVTLPQKTGISGEQS